ncbi:P3N-PIPO [Sweet potato feathery mottle virus]|uniref:P3N-PIPO n=1 Tax=Sweet potato feathery mottle virus TaxID=12844 RepID=UPI000C12B702|nr:P3N-PIPO [Sweet potato feathery mottle virus]
GDVQERCIRTIIKGVYKPDVMYTILSEDPYALLLSVMSPRILLALLNSGSLDRSMEAWITEDQEVAVIIGTLQELAKKVSTSRVLEKQLKVIESQAHTLLFDPAFVRSRTPSFALSQKIIRGLAEGRESNRVLYEQGHSIASYAASHELMEKIWDRLFKGGIRRTALAWKMCTNHAIIKTCMWFTKYSNMAKNRRFKRQSNRLMYYLTHEECHIQEYL